MPNAKPEPGGKPDLSAPHAGAGEAMLAWYDRHRRILPWRGLAGEQVDPYRVWLSEIMLQQTTVESVKPYFAKFLTLWPDVTALARAGDQAVLTAWAGLGYYARARNLIACARMVADDFGGCFPDTEDGLRALPGVGAYTAAAIAAIAFNRPAVVIDGNIERVTTRMAAIATPLPAAKAEVRAVLAPLVPVQRPGDFAQALMDLGAGVCTPRNPDCPGCPLRPFCAGSAGGEPTRYPFKAKKKPKPVRYGLVHVLYDGEGRLLLRTRPGKGLLAGMAEVPGSDWTETAAPAATPPLAASWQRRNMGVTHVFTHFELRLAVEFAQLAGTIPPPPGMRWVSPAGLAEEPLPTLFRKVLASIA
jgi:A/G-specific adenine glycosylase